MPASLLEMNVVFALIGVSVVLVIVIAIVLLWAVRSGQFEDMEGPAWRVVMDDDRAKTAAETKNESDPALDAKNSHEQTSTPAMDKHRRPDEARMNRERRGNE